MKNHNSSSIIHLLCFCLVLVSVATSLEFDNVGRVVRGQLESLYSLRNKLGGSTSSSLSPSSSSTGTKTIINSSPVGDLSPSSASVRKESRGYAFHYSPSEVSLPVHSPGVSSFSSRLGKLDDDEQIPSIISQPQKKLIKIKYNSNNKHSKHSKSYVKNNNNNNSLNSFNVHQIAKTTVHSQEHMTSTILPTLNSPPSTTISSLTAINPSDLTAQSSATTAPAASTMELPSIQTIGQGLNQAMTAVLTQKLMSMLDQDVPHGLLNPLRHLVASGNSMIEFWDKRTNARDGKKPGIVEMLGYGLDQLKGFRDGQSIKLSDPVANISSASQTLIQGMITVKRLTNRVLGYDTTNEVESRGGYGHDSYGHGGGGYGQYMSYGGSGLYGGLDPFSLLAALAFGAFLLQLLLTLLNSSARSLNVVDINTPLMMSDFHLPKFLTSTDKFYGTPTVRNKREVYESNGEEENMFYSIIDKLDGMYKTYKQVSEKPKCARLHLCRLAVDEAYMDESSLLSPVYIFGLGQLGKDDSASQFVKSIKDRVINGEDIDCDKLVTNCAIPEEDQ